MLPWTKTVPKELAPILATPAIELVVAEAARNGADDVLLVLADGKQSVAGHFRPDPPLEAALAARGDTAGLAAIRRPTRLARIHTATQATPRGLGDAIGCAAHFAADGPVMVLLPDELTARDRSPLPAMLDTYDRHGGVVLSLTSVPREDIGRYGCAVPGHQAGTGTGTGEVITVVGLVEKPDPALAPSTLAVTGRYILPPAIYPALVRTSPGRGGEIQLTDAIASLIDAGVPVHGVITTGHRYDTGNRLDYVKTVVAFAEADPDIGAEFTAWLHTHAREQMRAGATFAAVGTAGARTDAVPAAVAAPHRPGEHRHAPARTALRHPQPPTRPRTPTPPLG